MAPNEREALSALHAQMRVIHDELAELHAGICLLHLEAAIAALESHLLRSGPAMQNQPHRPVSAQEMR